MDMATTYLQTKNSIKKISYHFKSNKTATNISILCKAVVRELDKFQIYYNNELLIISLPTVRTERISNISYSSSSDVGCYTKATFRLKQLSNSKAFHMRKILTIFI